MSVRERTQKFNRMASETDSKPVVVSPSGLSKKKADKVSVFFFIIILCYPILVAKFFFFFDIHNKKNNHKLSTTINFVLCGHTPKSFLCGTLFE